MVRIGIAVGLALLVGTAAAQEGPVLKGQKQRTSYALGLDWGNRLKKQSSTELDVGLLVQGLKDAFAGGKTLLTEEEVKATLSALQIELRAKEVEAAKQLGVKNKKKGEAFLTENKIRDGVVTLKSGLQYKILKAGEGKKPSADDTVVCHYRGTFTDGTEFENSYKSNQPATFPLKLAIKGWVEALQLMPVGSKWRIFVPPTLAYAERGSAGGIGPNVTLIYEVELISIMDKFQPVEKGPAPPGKE